jgi:transposase
MTTQAISTEAFEAQLEISQKETERLQAENAKLKDEIQYIKEQLSWFQRQIFGKRSEKTIQEPPCVVYLPGMEPTDQENKVEEKTIPEHTRKKPTRDGKDKIVLPDNLPIEKQIIDIPEDQKICPETGSPLVKIGEDVTQKLAMKPGSFFIKQIIRPKYAAPKNPDLGIVSAQLPESLLNRCQADESFLADVLVKKYGDHLPLYRQSEILSRQGIMISRQTLCNWVIRAGIALQPLREEMTKQILKSDNVFIDETPIQLLESSKGNSKQGYMWVLAGGLERDPPYRIYEFYENRKHCNAEKLLGGYRGVLHSDKYGAYEDLANRKVIIWCPCWVHIRRKFLEIESGDLEFRDFVLGKINNLFKIDQEAWTKSPEERLQIRQLEEVPIIDELINLIKDRLTNGFAHKPILLKSKYKEALGYFYSLIPYLKNYTLHPFARLDNNVAERCIRPLAIGRKNWLFIGNEDAGEAAATIYSLVQTCRALKINPQNYLEDVMRRLMSHPANKLIELLPDRWEKK